VPRGGPGQVTAPLAELLQRQAADHPEASHHLDTVLVHRRTLHRGAEQVLDYLTQELDQQRNRATRPADRGRRPPSRKP
jgi:hypothetical protein